MGLQDFLSVWPVTCASVTAFLLIPLLCRVMSGKERWNVRCGKRVVARVPLSFASKYLRNPLNLLDYEQKVTKAIDQGRVKGADGQEYTLYTLTGEWWGIPWKATFNMKYTEDGGFHSTVVPRKENNYERVVTSMIYIDGGFTLSPTDDGESKEQECQIFHYEAYRFTWFFPLLWVFALAWKQWHCRGMEEEMKTLKQALEIAYKAGPKDGGGEAAMCPKSAQAHFRSNKYQVSDYIKESVMCTPYHRPALPLDFVQMTADAEDVNVR
mmetsp:Transcript_10686/g.26194  ORF Transcript_10686/g.26194 Transcript_10686/m.26194 type:complete len:268 (+) Transcript_10686:41-844(+)